MNSSYINAGCCCEHQHIAIEDGVDYDCTPILDFSQYSSVVSELEGCTSWDEVSQSDSLSAEFTETYADKLNWDILCKHMTFTEYELEKYSKYFSDECIYNIIPEYQRLSESYISEHRYQLNWDVVSRYQVMSEKFINNMRDYVNWISISIYQKLSENFILTHSENISWTLISRYQNLSEEFIDRFADKLDWVYISCNQNISEEFIINHIDRIDWDKISTNRNLSDGFIINHIDKLTLFNIVTYPGTSQHLINYIFTSEYADDDTIDMILSTRVLSETILRDNINILNNKPIRWCLISLYQKLSEEFIDEYSDKVDWFAISSTQDISEAFIEEHANDVVWSNILSRIDDYSPRFIKINKNMN